MTPIYVWAVVTDERTVLLMPATQADGWSLPGGALLDTDETVEDAMLREIERHFGVRLPQEPEFLDTHYERRQDGTTLVHNLFHVPSADLGSSIAERHTQTEWLHMDRLEGAPLPGWLRRGLAALFDDEAMADPSFDLTEFQAAVQRLAPTAPVFIITGPAGAGKSSVAQELCRRFPRAAHVEADLVRHMVRSGYASPVPGEADPDEAARQEELAQRNAAELARNFAFAGFVAIIDDVVEQPDELDHYLANLAGLDVAFITLLPDAESVRRRDQTRASERRMGPRAAHLHGIIAANRETRGLRLDTSAWSVEETVDMILERLDEARVGEETGV